MKLTDQLIVEIAESLAHGFPEPVARSRSRVPGFVFDRWVVEGRRQLGEVRRFERVLVGLEVMLVMAMTKAKRESLLIAIDKIARSGVSVSDLSGVNKTQLRWLMGWLSPDAG